MMYMCACLIMCVGQICMFHVFIRVPNGSYKPNSVVKQINRNPPVQLDTQNLYDQPGICLGGLWTLEYSRMACMMLRNIKIDPQNLQGHLFGFVHRDWYFAS